MASTKLLTRKQLMRKLELYWKAESRHRKDAVAYARAAEAPKTLAERLDKLYRKMEDSDATAGNRYQDLVFALEQLP